MFMQIKAATFQLREGTRVVSRCVVENSRSTNQKCPQNANIKNALLYLYLCALMLCALLEPRRPQPPEIGTNVRPCCPT